MEHFMLPRLQVDALFCSYSLATVVKAFNQLKFQEIANLYHLEVLKNMIKNEILCACFITVSLTYSVLI